MAEDDDDVSPFDSASFRLSKENRRNGGGGNVAVSIGGAEEVGGDASGQRRGSFRDGVVAQGRNVPVQGAGVSGDSAATQEKKDSARGKMLQRQ